MRISGEWYFCDDGVVRPVIRGELLTGDGSWVRAPFLVDTGADRTVLSAAIPPLLRLPHLATQAHLGGLGGLIRAVIVETQIRLSREDDGRVIFRSRYAAVTEREALDMSVLGRDITGLFALIIDQPGNVVCLLGQWHRYTIEQR